MALDFPSAPAVGDTYTGPSGQVWLWDGVKWSAAPSGGPAGGVIVSDTAPASPAVGALWWDTVSLKLYMWTGDEWSISVNTPEGNFVQVSSRNVGRNLLDNALFLVNQRGAGPWSASGAYTSDRWEMYGGVGDTYTVSVVTLTDADRAAIGDESAMNALQIVFTGASNATSFILFCQKIEYIRRLSGKNVTSSLWARAAVGSPRIGVNTQQNFGTGGSPSAVTFGTPAATTALSAAWARYPLSPVIPSSAGKTFGTNGGTDYTELDFWLSAGGNYNTDAGSIGVQSGTVVIWGPQLECVAAVTNPPTVTPLEKRDPESDLARCQRFYQIGTVGIWMYNAAGGNTAYDQQFSVTMRAQPTITLSGENLANCTGLTAGANNNSTIYASATTTTLGSTAFTANFQASADL